MRQKPTPVSTNKKQTQTFLRVIYNNNNRHQEASPNPMHNPKYLKYFWLKTGNTTSVKPIRSFLWTSQMMPGTRGPLVTLVQKVLMS